MAASRTLLSALAAAALATSARAATPIQVNTTYGPVIGEAENGLIFFRSIPFAEPPLGDLRFSNPQPPAPWTTPRDVRPAANVCLQAKIDGNLGMGTEDCLQLSITIPEGAGLGGKLPVMFWIYGGAWVLGDSEELGFYDPKALVSAKNVIVVAPNYRLGPFGFMALNALKGEAENGNSTGNAALLDQVAALQWTRANIARFGGDPDNLTIFGESAGGFSVCWHLVSPLSKGLFNRAIMESGTCDSPQFFQSLQYATDFNSAYSDALGCPPSSTEEGRRVYEQRLRETGSYAAPDAIAAREESAALVPVGNTSDPQLACMRSHSAEHILLSLLDLFNPNWPYVDGDSTVPGPDGKGRVGPSPFTGPGSAWNGTAFLHHDVGVPSVMAAKNMPALAPFMPWGAAIDGVALPDLPLTLLQKGPQHFNSEGLRLILGTNKDEGTMFIPLFALIVPNVTFPPRESDLPRIIEHAFDMFPAPLLDNLTSNTILPAYPASAYPPDGQNWYRGSDVLTHCFFACAARRTSRALVSAGVPVHLYQWSYAMHFPEALLLKNYHASELNFVWGNAWPPVLHNFDANDRSMIDIIQSFWTNFAYTADPNSGPSPAAEPWPTYNNTLPDGEVNMQLQLPLSITTDLLAYQCDLWDQFYYTLRATQEREGAGADRAALLRRNGHGPASTAAAAASAGKR